MNIYVYWNTNDNDCTKIFHFMSLNDDYSLVNMFETDHSLKIDRKYKPYDELEPIYEEILKNDLIIFLTHGTEDEILKYRNKPDKNFKDYVLLDKERAGILKDKIVLALCCSSAKNLGRVSVKIGCKAFVGFERDIVYDNGKAKKSRHIIYESYKIAFMKSLKYAIKTKCSVGEYRIKLMQYLRKESSKAIMLSKNHTLHNMYSGTIDGLVALGDITQQVIY